MALTGATLTNIAYALKEFYLPSLRNQLNEDTILLKRVQRDEENVVGKDATIFLKTGRNTSASARNQVLPAPGVTVFSQTKIPMKKEYGRIEIEGIAIEATKNDRGAIKRIVDNEMQGMSEALKKDINRQLWGCGYGVLARWSSGGSTALVVQKKYRANSAGGDGFGSTFGAKYIQPHDTDAMATQMVCVVLTGGTGIVADDTPMYPSVVTVGTVTDAITVSDPGVSEAAGTFYVHGDASEASIYGTTAITRREIMGLRGIVTDEVLDHILTDGSTPGVTTDDTLQSLAISESWKGNVVYCGLPGGGTRYAQQNPLTLDDMQRAWDAGPEHLGAEYEPTLVLAPYALRRALVADLEAARRFSTMTLDGGYTAINFNGKPLVVDSDAIDGEIYFLYEPSLKIYRMSDFNWMDRDGAVLSRIKDYDAYEAVLYAYMEFGCDRRRANSVLVDIDY